MKLLADRAVNALFSKIAFFTVAFCMASALFFFLLPKKAAVCILISALCMVLCIVAGCYQYLVGQGERIENAAAQITDYISGNTDTRIECDEEGSLCLLFHRINMLASILDARVKREEKARGFLKNIISDISHQLKTPLAALNIYNGIIQSEAEGIPAILEFSLLSEQELDRIETLVQNLLKITKLDAGMIVLEKSFESVAELAESVKKYFLFRAEQEGKEIVLSGEKEALFFCDRSWIMEAVSNLVKNALDHTEKGDFICIEWQVFASVVQITIKDNGSGICPEDLHHIFKRFYRSRFSKDMQGLGLGLSLTKAIVEAHNGTIEADSTLGIGTSFTMNFLTYQGSPI